MKRRIEMKKKITTYHKVKFNMQEVLNALAFDCPADATFDMDYDTVELVVFWHTVELKDE